MDRAARGEGRLRLMGHVMNRAGRPTPVQIDRSPRMGQSWYSINNRSITAEDAGKRRRCAQIHIYEEIGFWGVTAQDFVRELNALEDVDEIDLHLNSPGGDVFDGITIYNALVNHPAAVTVHVDGLAASAASFIAQAGDRVVMGRGAMMMIHDAAGFALGNAGDMRSMADLLDKVSDTIAGIYAARSGIDAATWRKRMLAESWYRDTEAVEAGLADESADTRDEQATDKAAAWVRAKYGRAPVAPRATTATADAVEPASGDSPAERPDPVTVQDPQDAADGSTGDDSDGETTASATDQDDSQATADAACTCECEACTDGSCEDCTDQCDLCDESDCPCMDDQDEEGGDGGEEEEPVEDSTTPQTDPTDATPTAEPADTAPVPQDEPGEPPGQAPGDPFQDAMTELLTQTPTPTGGGSTTSPTADTWADLVARLVGPPSSETADDVLARMREALT